MSTILKALRKLEQDRSVQGERPLREEVAISTGQPPPERSRRPRAWVLFGAAGVLLFGLGLGAAFVLLEPGSFAESPSGPLAAAAPEGGGGSAPARSDAASRGASAPRDGAAGSASPGEPAPAPVARSTADAGGLSPEALASEVALVRPIEPRRLFEEEPAPAPEPARAAEAPGPSARSAPPPAESTRPAPEPAETAPAPTREAAPAAAGPPEPARTAAVSAAPAAASAPSAPGVSPVPDPPAPAAEPARQPGTAAGERLPDVFVERTVWHPSADRRTAVLVVDGRRGLTLREGDRVGPLRIESIEPSGVVFDHAGVDLRQAVGGGRWSLP